jgi:hypothetical protein
LLFAATYPLLHAGPVEHDARGPLKKDVCDERSPHRLVGTAGAADCRDVYN